MLYIIPNFPLSQYWGVAQRRRRIFLIADFGGLTAPEILFKQDRLLGDFTQSRSAWQGAAASAQGSTIDTGGTCLTPWDVQSRRIFEETGTWPALYGGEGGGHGYIKADEKTTEPLISQPNCLTAWDTQQSRVFTPEGVAPTLAGADGLGGRNPAGLLFTAAFVPNAGAAAQNIGYQDECSPTLKTSHAPAVFCLNDQGGNVMSCSEDVVGTLRAQEHGHQPLVMATQQGGAEIGVGVCPTITASAGMSGNNQPVLYENHGVDSRYTGPHAVSPAISARAGMGGNNLPLIGTATAYSLDAKESNSMKSSNPYSGCRQTDTARTIDTGNPDPSKNQGGIAILQEAICIAGNTIDRQPQNGGNGLGCQLDIAYTLTSTDRHSICEPYQEIVGTLCSGDEKGIGNQYVSQDKCIVEKRNLIRRLTPLECERLQGFPDGWTLIPGCSDSGRYKALGNSVAIPCVEFLLRGVAYCLQQIYDEQGKTDV